MDPLAGVTRKDRLAGPGTAKGGPTSTRNAPLEPVVTGQNVELREAVAYPSPIINGYRLALRVKRMDESKPVELRAFLRGPDTGAISETWSYLLPPS